MAMYAMHAFLLLLRTRIATVWWMPAIQAVFSILNMAPKTILLAGPLSRLQVLAGEVSNPGCIELLPAEKLASHVDGDCQVAAAGRRL